MLRFIFIFSLLVYFFITSSGYSVSAVNNNQQQDSSFVEIINKKAEDESRIIFFNPVWFSSIKPPPHYEMMSLEALLEVVLPSMGYKTITFEPNYLIIVRDIRAIQYSNNDQYEREETYSDYKYDITESFSITGILYDNKNSEPLIGATLYIQEVESGTITNEFGRYTITLPSSLYHITVNALGFDSEEFEVPLVKDTTIDLTLYDKTTQLEEIIVYDEAEDHNVSDISMGTDKLNIETLQRIPPFMGEIDVIRSIMLLPGITTTGEGATGFNVRGGSIDQNLILLDEAPIYNSSHLFGFFTAFNSAAIKDVTISKGGIPAQYGGRISSILDVKLKQGNRNKFTGSGNIGLIASDVVLEGPIIKDKTTFVASGRVSYTDWYIKNLPDNYLNNSSAFFYDYNVKLTHQINKNNTLSLSGYSSHDTFKFPGDTTYGWDNMAATLKLSSSLSPRLFMINSLVYSAYSYKVYGNEPENAFRWNAGINYYGLKSDFVFNPNLKNKIDAGLNIIYHQVDLGNLQPDHELSNINPTILDPEQAMEAAVYYNHELKINTRLTLMGGLRYSYYAQLGPGTVKLYDPDYPKRRTTVTDVIQYDRNAVMTSYHGPEPRVSVRYGIGRNTSIKASYNRMRQYIGLISNTSAVSPVDIWKLSDRYLPPQVGDQVAVGIFKNFKSNMFETSFEFYYKKIRNSIDYKDGANLTLNEDLEIDLINGEITTLGAELLIRKNKGRLNGWIAYTLSNAERRVAGKFPEETINNGAFYPVNYDKLHDLAVVGNYDFTQRYRFGFSFIYYSGRPITYPTGSYGYLGFLIANFELRNQERIPAYHRLDLSFTINGNHKKNKKWHGSWTFSVYNLYARKNPYSVYFKAKGYIVAQAYRLSVIGTAVPSITYNFKF